MKRVVVVGGGASGVFFSIFFKKNNPDCEVIILEQNDRVLKKILKTGNGRCNIMNYEIGEIYYNNYALIEKNSVKYSMIDKFEELGILLKSDFEGRVYPYHESAKSVVNALLEKLNEYGVIVKTNYKVESIKKANSYLINNDIECDYLVFATGSKAQEQTNGYEILEKLGHKITELVPGLVPLYTKENTEPLKGIRWKCMIIHKGRCRDGEVQFKDKGISGIMIMDLSNDVEIGEEIYLDLMPEITEFELNYMVKKNGYDILKKAFPKMLFQDIYKRANYKDENMVNVIKNFKYTITGRRGFDVAQICMGGVDLSCITNNFESKKCKKMYIIGEVLDVNGGTGGYNLYFAWLSAYAAHVEISKKIRND